MKTATLTRTLIILLLAALFGGVGCQSSQPAEVEDSPPDVPTVEELQDQLAQRRALNIARLHDYRMASVYPHNRVVPGQANVFIDEDGRHCAVANLMRLDGEDELVALTAATNNLVVLADVHDGPLNDWMLSSGFTRDEIARIQEPYFFEIEDPNFEATENQRLDDHFERVEEELTMAETRAILEAARAQRAEILRQAR